MKAASSSIRIFVAWIAWAALANASAWAQFEVAPDHFEFSAAQPFPQPRNVNQTRSTQSTQYDASFTLPYALQCKGRRLPAGKYSVSLRSQGKVGQATLHRGGRTLGLQGFVREPDHSRKDDALIVELSGNILRLSAIHVAALDLVLDSARVGNNAAGTQTRHIDQVALIPTHPTK